MSLLFVTSNAGKLAEIQAVIPDVQALDIDLPEIQSIDARRIIEAKLQEALNGQDGPLIVEDTSLYIDSLNGLPGPLIKWFIKTVDLVGIHKMASTMGNGDTSAFARTCIGYANASGEVEFFEASIKGRIVAPRGDNGFGWDSIFQPDGYEQTFAEMDRDTKNSLSMRRQAAEKLRAHLQT
jgi:non-canonical purine NTP pyrophosphatase (RdgB/HAM1 family)